MTLNIDIVDFHTHILPGADHGSDSLKTSLAQLRLARDFGVKRIIATSHFYPNAHTVKGFLKQREEAYLNLLPHLGEELPEVKLGAEVLICSGIERLPELQDLFIEGTNTLLLELPFTHFSEEFYDSVASLISSGAQVVLAHADRYPVDCVEKMISSGATVQLNASALSGLLVPRRYFEWIDRGVVSALGSDIHGVDKRAYKSFVKATLKLGTDANKIKEKSDEIWNKAKSCKNEK